MLPAHGVQEPDWLGCAEDELCDAELTADLVEADEGWTWELTVWLPAAEDLVADAVLLLPCEG